ncbi:MAG: hypothetical protein ACU837_09860 [Gammaproteobacteria bacterium]
MKLLSFNKTTLAASILGSCVCLSALADEFKVTRLFPTVTWPSVTFTDYLRPSPLLDTTNNEVRLIVADSNNIALLDGNTGALVKRIALPLPAGQSIEIAATPLRLHETLFVVYQTSENSSRMHHFLAAIDLRTQQIDARFALLELSATARTADGQTLKFNPPTAYSHAALKHIPNNAAGYLYASFGNAGDTQPFHGWLFEIDIDAWRTSGADKAVRSTLVTTAESECPVHYEYGTQEMICGGGIWNPAGPQVYAHNGRYELFAATGNGQLDLARRDFAGTVMRLEPGLQFDPGCDAQLCANFNPAAPAEACMASCKNLFIPRLLPKNDLLRPADGSCDGKTFTECIALMDYDLGANAPLKVTLRNGPAVIVQPGKEGAVYLIDAQHLGRLYDRRQIVPLCGTVADPCKAGWRGMIVTAPVQTEIDGDPVVIVPTFMSDDSQAAGLIALKIVMENGSPKFRPFWRFPAVDGLEATRTFRSHPSFPLLTREGINREPYVWIVDIQTGMRSGTLYAVRVRDGVPALRHTLLGTGRQLSHPLMHNGILYLGSNAPGKKHSWIEAYRIDYRP